MSQCGSHRLESDGEPTRGSPSWRIAAMRQHLPFSSVSELSEWLPESVSHQVAHDFRVQDRPTSGHCPQAVSGSLRRHAILERYPSPRDGVREALQRSEFRRPARAAYAESGHVSRSWKRRAAPSCMNSGACGCDHGHIGCHLSTAEDEPGGVSAQVAHLRRRTRARAGPSPSRSRTDRPAIIPARQDRLTRARSGRGFDLQMAAQRGDSI